MWELHKMMTTICRENSQSAKRWQKVSNATERVKLRLCVQNICRYSMVGRNMKTEVPLEKCNWTWNGQEWWMMEFTSNRSFVSAITGLHVHLVPMRSMSRLTQSNDWLVPLHLLLSLHNSAVTSDKENIIVPSGLADLPWPLIIFYYTYSYKLLQTVSPQIPECLSSLSVP